MRLKKFQHYFSNLFLIWLAILIYNTFNYYTNFLKQDSQTTLLILAISYTLIAPGYYLLTKNPAPSKGTLSLKAITKLSKKILQKKENRSKILPAEKNALLFAIVKFFFLPIMLNFTFGNYSALKNQLPLLTQNIFTIEGFNQILFPIALTALFFIDTLWFAFGYTFESSKLKNKLRSVEPTLLGWIVALACYPPFNSFVTGNIGWHANDYVLFGMPELTFAIRAIIIILLSIYVAATLALGTKCSNLTNRGIVSRGPYAIIRHPAYISKNAAWWLTIIPVFSLTAFLSMATWSLIYHLRTITEERHLSKDPDYLEYKKKVKYRYIPGIY